MRFTPTSISGSYLIDLERREDSRGFFARLFCEEEFRAHGLRTHWAQMNNSFSARKGTLRGMHYQLPPAADAKVIRVMQGALYDVILDVRPDSPSYRQWVAVELSAAARQMIYVPPGCAHGFITLADATEVLYLVGAPHVPECERGLRYDDPALAIRWPMAPAAISDKDTQWPDFNEAYHGVAQCTGLS